jgi:hypothetical protein
MKKVIIAGGRDFDDYKLLKEKCDYLLVNLLDDIEIVSGRCSTGKHTFDSLDGIKVYGTDGLGELYASEKGYPVKPFPADWATHKRSAGPVRNAEMVEYADFLIAFFDGFSRGTEDIIKKAKEKGLKVAVVKY